MDNELHYKKVAEENEKMHWANKKLLKEIKDLQDHFDMYKSCAESNNAEYLQIIENQDKALSFSAKAFHITKWLFIASMVLNTYLSICLIFKG